MRVTRLFAILFCLVATPAWSHQAQLAFDVAADFSPAFPTNLIPANAHHFAIVYKFEGQPPKHLHTRFVAVEVPGVDAGKVAMEADASIGKGWLRAVTRYTVGRHFPEGRYRVEITGDGEAWPSFEFAATRPIDMPAIKKAEEVMPLRPGAVWEYQFVSVEQPSPGIRVRVPEIPAADADGMLRATMTRTLVESDGKTLHFALARNQQQMLEEWQQVTNRGIAVVKRASYGETAAFDPPAVSIPLPLSGPYQSWSWYPKSHEFTQSYEMWGPVPIKVGNSQRNGFVILQTQKIKGETMPTSSAEYHVVPGIGVVHSIEIEATGNGVLRMRNEMTLVKGPDGAL